MAGRTEISAGTTFNLNPQAANEFFLSPIFVSENILNNPWIRVKRDVKQTATLFYAGPLEEIIKANVACGFDPQGSMSITQRTITVSRHEIELEMCTDEFWDTCLEYALGQEMDLFNLDAEPAGRVIRDAIITRTQQGFLNDMFSLAFFADDASAYPFLAQANGWFKQIDADIAAGLTPTAPNVSGIALTAGQSEDMFEALLTAQTDVMESLDNGEKAFLVSRSVWENYRQFLKSNQNVESSWNFMQNGSNTMLMYCGIPVVKCPQFDMWDNVKLGGTEIHRALLVSNKNLTVGTDIRGSETRFETGYDRREKTHDIMAAFKLGFQVAFPELVVTTLIA